MAPENQTKPRKHQLGTLGDSLDELARSKMDHLVVRIEEDSVTHPAVIAHPQRGDVSALNTLDGQTVEIHAVGTADKLGAQAKRILELEAEKSELKAEYVSLREWVDGDGAEAEKETLTGRMEDLGEPEFVIDCKCGGQVLGTRQHGRLFTWCDSCTPRVEVEVGTLDHEHDQHKLTAQAKRITELTTELASAHEETRLAAVIALQIESEHATAMARVAELKTRNSVLTKRIAELEAAHRAQVEITARLRTKLAERDECDERDIVLIDDLIAERDTVLEAENAELKEATHVFLAARIAELLRNPE